MIPPTGTFVLFLRHGERAPLPPDDPYADVDLTPAGYDAVAALARTLDGRLAWTAASPFRRCRVTARGLGPMHEDDTRLGRHGPWVEEHAEASRQFASLGTEEVVRAQVRGESVPGLRQPEVAVPILLSAGLDRVHRGSGACITHDAVLMPAMAWLFGVDAANDWLAPLGGFCLQMRASGPVACWNGRQRPC